MTFDLGTLGVCSGEHLYMQYVTQQFIKYSTGMLYAILLYVPHPSVCLSVCFHHNSRTSGRKIMKLSKVILEVVSGMELEGGSRP